MGDFYGVHVLALAKFARGRSAYFLDGAQSSAVEGTRLVESDGTWIGSGIEGLREDRVRVDGPALERLFDGCHPLTGEALDSGHDRVRIAGFDCMFAAPKSVSLLFALADHADVAAILAAHDRAVGEVIGYLERHASFVVRSQLGERHSVRATGYVGASFVHRTSRLLDPHLHTHVLIVNLGRDGNGRWSALDARGLYQELATARALYGAHLRYETSMRIGVHWTLRSNGFGDVVGLPPAMLRAFSRRDEAIRDELESNERTSGASRRIAAARDASR